MADSMKQLLTGIKDKQTEVILRRCFDALSADIGQIVTKHNALATKLDADAGVTDTNYNSLTGITNQQTLP